MEKILQDTEVLIGIGGTVLMIIGMIVFGIILRRKEKSQEEREKKVHLESFISHKRT